MVFPNKLPKRKKEEEERERKKLEDELIRQKLEDDQKRKKEEETRSGNPTSFNTEDVELTSTKMFYVWSWT